MKSAPTTQEIVDRAHQAQRLLDDPTLQKAFAGVRDALVAKLEECQVDDVQLQHELALSLQLLKTLRRTLSNWVSDGQLEAARSAERARWFNRKQA